MTTHLDWKSFALCCCLIACTVAPSATVQGEIVPMGRRKTMSSPQRSAAGQSSSTRQRQTLQQQQTLRQRQMASNARRLQVRDPKSDPLYQLAERAIEKTSKRYLDADQHTPWQIMHGVVASRRDFELTRGSDKINCIDFVSSGPTFRGEPWWQATKHGARPHPFSVPYAFEGHANQFLALLSTSNLPLTHQFKVDNGRTVTMADMVNNAKMTVNDPNGHGEITWTLWFLTHYIDIDSEWTNEWGEHWSMERLVKVQTAAKVTNAPCGGTHGLYAIAYARNAFLQKHGRLAGVYFQAEQKINKHIEMARSMQNHDGSLSTEFYKGPGHSRDFNERIKASGHLLEWLMMGLPQRRLNEPWVRKAVASISTDLIHNAAKPAECGPLYHALNSLIMYRDRISPPAQTPATTEMPQLAKTPATTKKAPVLTKTSPMQEPAKLPLSVADTTPAKGTPLTKTTPATKEMAPPALAAPSRIMTPKKLTAPAPSVVKQMPTIEPENVIATVKPAEPQIPKSMQPVDKQLAPPVLAAPLPTRNLLADKAAQRLANIIRQDDDERPGLLDAPGTSPVRMAIDPRPAKTR